MPKFVCGNKVESFDFDEEEKTNLTKLEKESEGQEINNQRISKDIISEKNKLNKYLKDNNPFFAENLELQEMIGAGSESFVYKALCRKNKKVIVCKMIYKKEDEEEVNINKKELDIGMKLKNKNITNFFGSSTIQKNELYFIAMEYDKYGNLRNFQRNYLKRNILSEQLICYISYCILNGLKYIHMCKIAHMDLKPQNITVDDYLCFKIIDFSISIDYSKMDEIKLQTIGTNFYMSPEVLSNKTIKAKDLNKVDLYSLGVILYNLAFGDYPYNLSYEESEDYDKIEEKIKSNWEIKNEDNIYSELFIDFLKKLLEKDIEKRININQALNHPWVKGAKILLDEKEKVFQCSNFLLYLLTDHFKSFNDYVRK